MFEPPPGYEDLLADAEAHPGVSEFEAWTVPGVGLVSARRPMPDAVALLAMASNSVLDAPSRIDYMMRFIHVHVSEADVERVLFDMMAGDLPANAMDRMVRSIVTWGTARPYVAVVSLAVMAAHHWRTIRQKLLMAGVTDPMGLGSMHRILDAAEALAVESATGSEQPQRELESLYRRLYGPSPDDLDPVPSGFQPDEVEASFDAFARAAAG